MKLLKIITIAATLSIAADTGAAPSPHVVVIGGDAEYGSRTTTSKIADRLKTEFGFRTTLIHSHVGVLENSDEPDKSIPGLEAIQDADLLIIYIRMRTPPVEQLELLHNYFESGKPAIGMRTTTHAFTNDRGWCPRYFGGHYWSHFGDEIELFTLPAQDGHPILRGVPRHASQSANGVYLTNPLGESATPLVLAKRSNDTPAESYAWINEYKPGSRQFFFTAGHPSEFDEPHNAALLYNAVFWCLEREVPPGGVLEGPRPVERMKLTQKVPPPMPPTDTPPAGAIALFEGDDLRAWDWWFGGKEPRAFELDGRAHSGEGLPNFSGARWKVENGAAIATTGVGDIITREEFTDYHLHLDFLIPESPADVDRLWRGNSGVYLNGRYEVQIVDTSKDEEVDQFSCGAITGQRAPDVQACRAAGKWQSLDVYFRAPRYRYGRMKTPARATVLLNDQMIHQNAAIPRSSEWGLGGRGSSGPLAGPIRLEADTGPVRFANIWIRPLDSTEVQRRLPDHRELTGKPWIDMNYGPFLSASIEVAPGNIANKGIAVRVDKGPGGVSAGNEFLMFETDTLRYAAGWIGPSCIDWRGIAFNGEHETHASLVGHVLFSNPEGPGWAKPGTEDFQDSRLTGRDGRHYGPVDRSWAKWNGLYRNGDRVILSYSVGDTDILEMPGAAAESEMPVLTRTLQIGPRTEDLVMQVAHDPSGTVTVHEAENGTDQPLISFLSLGQQGEEAAGREEEDDDDEEEEEEEEEDEDEDEGDEEEEEGEGLFFDEDSIVIAKSDDFDMTSADYTVFARIRTEENGTIFSKAPREGPWAENGKTLFTVEGRLAFDIGWVGAVVSEREVADGDWHDIAMTFNHAEGTVALFVDGQADAEASLAPFGPVEDHVVRVGFTSPDFPEFGPAFYGRIEHGGFYQRALSAEEIAGLAEGEVPEEGLVARWKKFDHDTDTLVDATSGGHDGRLEDVEIWELEGDVEDDEEEGLQPGLVGRWAAARYTVCGVAGASGSLSWKTDADGNVRLVIPAGDEPLRFVLAYVKADDPEDLDAQRAAIAATGPAVDLQVLCTGGDPQWNQSTKTAIGSLGPQDGPLVVDSLTLPNDNPHRSWMRLGGFDFFAGGRSAAVCTWQGDVWIVEGVDQTQGDLSWRRIAAGMFQPLGLKIVEGDIYVTCRDQITVLRDLNGDQEIDFYENFNNDAQVTEHFHEFAVGLQTDAEGNFYYCKCARHARDALVPQHGTLLKVSKDGASTEIVAGGFRAPNGLWVEGDGTFIVSDQEGHWTPKNRINRVQPGGFYGNLMGYHENKTPADVSPPITWIHNDYDRSPAEQLRVTSPKWGSLEGRLITLSYGTGRIHLVFEQLVGDQIQGGVVRLPTPDFPTGIMRGRFGPHDQQLYVCGLFGWSSDRTDPGGFYRVRATGKPLHLPVSVSANREGLELAFSAPLDPKSAENARNYSAAQWNYRATAEYGSEDYRVSNRRRRGRDRLRIQSASLSSDGRTLTLKIPRMRPAMQMELLYRIQSSDGTELAQKIHHTIHALEQP